MSPIPPANPAIADSLAMAVVAASTAPLLLLDGRFVVVAASASFCLSFSVAAETLIGQPITVLVGGWASPQIATLLGATARGHTDIGPYEMDLRHPGREPRRLILNATRLAYADPGETRLLLSVADVTEARLAAKLKDDMLREKAILLEELQHRVANSLQIIASVLLQTARRVQSEETRSHLQQAHLRVMSVAALQKHLAMTQVDRVHLRTYLAGLCESLGASMIHAPDRIVLTVEADNTTIEPGASVSIGLIVTELVINALKHAFTDDRRGTIRVGFHGDDADWTLSVIDDGAGMPEGIVPAGLGSSIVAALARQLDARIVTTDAHPGTSVSIVHAQGAGAGAGAGAGEAK